LVTEKEKICEEGKGREILVSRTCTVGDLAMMSRLDVRGEEGKRGLTLEKKKGGKGGKKGTFITLSYPRRDERRKRKGEEMVKEKREADSGSGATLLLNHRVRSPQGERGGRGNIRGGGGRGTRIQTIKTLPLIPNMLVPCRGEREKRLAEGGRGKEH